MDDVILRIVYNTINYNYDVRELRNHTFIIVRLHITFVLEWSQRVYSSDRKQLH